MTTQGVQLPLERRLLDACLADELTDVAELCLCAGRDDHGHAGSGRHRGSGVDAVVPLCQRRVRADLDIRTLGHRHRLTSQRRLDDAQLGAREHARVSRNGLPGIERHDVAGDEIAGVDLTENAVAEDCRPSRFQPVERLDGAVRANLDREPQPHVQYQHRGNGQGVGHVLPVAAATIAPATSSSTTTLLHCAASTTHHAAGRPARQRVRPDDGQPGTDVRR